LNDASVPFLHLEYPPIGFLYVTGGADHGRIFIVTTEHRRIIIGREPICDVRLSDRWVARRHCQLDIQPMTSMAGIRNYRFLVADLDSRNGTFLNGNHINTNGVPLTNGARIELGGCVITFYTISN
jgi:pSer/pThr/pTyr-binding forkhead associated (FHA) protein